MTAIKSFLTKKKKKVKFKRLLSIVLLVANFNDLVLIFLSTIGTYICKTYGFIGDLPMSFLFTSIIFPIVFSINSAYRRREDALRCLADIKAHGLALYLASKNWTMTDQKADKIYIRNLLVSFYADMREYLTQDSETMEKGDANIYEKFSRISIFIQELRKGGTTPSELSRLDQYLSKIMTDYERLKSVLLYRTPYSLRSFTLFFNYSFPLFCAPYFGYYLTKYSTEPYYELYYLLPVLYSCILVSLSNIQDQLENPFDMDSDDDLRIDENELADAIQNVEAEAIKFERI
jgi:predicted membrane chloride channel (bestrophin family)